MKYDPQNIRNPALQFHYDFLAAKYLNEKFQPAEDQSVPDYSYIQVVSHGFHLFAAVDISSPSGINVNPLFFFGGGMGMAIDRDSSAGL